MRELRYAALLHDFGKLTVQEDVLVKAKKLPPLLWERVNGRFDLIHRTMEVEELRKRVRLEAGDDQAVDRLEAALANDLQELDRMRRGRSRRQRTPRDDGPVPVSRFATSPATRSRHATDSVVPFLTADELHYLDIAKGTLDDRERAEIESHVVETFRFLDQIPWTDDLKNLASYTYGHHEKLNGCGYPRHLKAEAIPLQTRMITLADIFDALTASDRPYKRAVPPDRALQIIQAEANAGLLDAELVRVMIASRAYERILDEDWHRF